MVSAVREATKTSIAIQLLNGATDANGSDLSMYMTNNYGGNWNHLTTPPYSNSAWAYSGAFNAAAGDQAYYDNTLAVDPSDACHVLAGAIALIETDDCGLNWSNVNGQPFGDVITTVPLATTIAAITSVPTNVLNVGSTNGFPPTPLTLSVAASGGTAVVSCTGSNATQFTGCTFVSGNATWTVAAGAAVTSVNVLHADFHALVFVPNTSDVLIGSDGGVYSYNSGVPRPSSVDNLNTNLNTALFYEDISVNGTRSWGVSRTTGRFWDK